MAASGFSPHALPGKAPVAGHRGTGALLHELGQVLQVLLLQRLQFFRRNAHRVFCRRQSRVGLAQIHALKGLEQLEPAVTVALLKLPRRLRPKIGGILCHAGSSCWRFLSVCQACAYEYLTFLKFPMFLILIALGWLYVALMMAVAEATSPVGSVLGALITFVLYGVGPVALLLYILATPARRRLRQQREAAETGGLAAGPDGARRFRPARCRQPGGR